MYVYGLPMGTHVSLVNLVKTDPDVLQCHYMHAYVHTYVPPDSWCCSSFTPADKPARISFEFPVYEVWEDRGPVSLRLKANKPLSMQGEQSVFIRPLEIIPVSARGE